MNNDLRRAENAVSVLRNRKAKLETELLAIKVQLHGAEDRLSRVQANGVEQRLD